MKLLMVFFACLLGNCSRNSYEGVYPEKAEADFISSHKRVDGCSGFAKNIHSTDTVPRVLRNFHIVWGQPLDKRDYTMLSETERDSIFPDSRFVGEPFCIIFTNVLCDTQLLNRFRVISDFHEKRDTSWNLMTAIGSNSDGMIFEIEHGKVSSMLRKAVDQDGQH